MQQKVTRNLLRAVLLAALLVIGLISGGTLDKSRPAHAKSCDEAFGDYLNANNTYEAARLSYFYDNPTSCSQDCQNALDQLKCIDDCRIDRHTALGQADLAMFSLALDTCVPTNPDECAQARASADLCLSQHNWNNYSDPDEAMAVAEQYMACREASKVDSCQ